MAKVLIMGSNLQSQLALLQRLQATTEVPGLALDLSHDFTDCDLLIFRDRAAQSVTARRIMSNHPWLPVWSVTDDGQLYDALPEPAVPLDERQIRTALERLHMIAGPAQTKPAQTKPVQAEAEPTPEAEPEAEADSAPLGEAIRVRLLAANAVAALSLHGKDLLLLDFRRLLVIVAPGVEPGETPPQLLGNHFSQLALRPLPAARYSALFVDLPSLPLIPTLWQAALRMHAEPTLLTPLHEGCALRLKRWPDFRVLAHRHDDFRLCSLLLRKACTVLQASHGLGVDPGAARAFFNAAWLTGYAQVESESLVSVSLPAVRPRGPGALLASMWRGVRGLKGD